MKLTQKLGRALVGAALAVVPVASHAQSNATTSDTTRTTYSSPDRENRHDFPWGLLGLLGLGGLLGLKRRDDVRDVHVDARRDRRP